MKTTYEGNTILERFADSLKSQEDKKLFLKMLNDRQKYALAVETLIMAFLLAQHKVIGWLHNAMVEWSEANLK
jgi:hypothetical protein